MVVAVLVTVSGGVALAVTDGNYDAARQQDLDAFRAFFHAMLARGVYLPPSAFEVWFLSAAHDGPVLDQVVDALPAAARAAAEAPA